MSTRRLKIGHFQCSCEAGDYDLNLQTLLRGLEQAAAENVEVISFPECFLNGYFETEEKWRTYGFRLEGPEIKHLLEVTRKYSFMFMVGFMEVCENKLYNTVALCETGKLIGTYRKAFPCTKFETPGRTFDVFEKNGIKFGIVICADGSYIEPTRILALKGARIIFAPHANYLGQDRLIDHFLIARHHHIARAVENGVWFLRGNSYHSGPDKGLNYPGVGYGDSYLLDPNGDVVIRAGLTREALISATIDTDAYIHGGKGIRLSRASIQELGALLMSISEAK